MSFPAYIFTLIIMQLVIQASCLTDCTRALSFEKVALESICALDDQDSYISGVAIKAVIFASLKVEGIDINNLPEFLTFDDYYKRLDLIRAVTKAYDYEVYKSFLESGFNAEIPNLRSLLAGQLHYYEIEHAEWARNLLLIALDDESDGIRIPAIRSLAYFPNQHVIDTLFAILDEEVLDEYDMFLKQAALFSIGTIGDNTNCPKDTLLKIRSEDIPFIAVGAAYALAQLYEDEPEYLNTYIMMTDEHYWDNKDYSVDSYSDFAAHDVRVNMGRIHQPEAMHYLIDNLKNEEHVIDTLFALELSEKYGYSAEAELINFINRHYLDPEFSPWANALDTLDSIAGETNQAREVFWKFFEMDDEGKMLKGARMLLRNNHDRAAVIVQLLEKMRLKNSTTQIPYIGLLGEYCNQDDNVLDILYELLDDDSILVRMKALIAIASIENREE